jgi:hypothetical protein
MVPDLSYQPSRPPFDTTARPIDLRFALPEERGVPNHSETLMIAPPEPQSNRWRFDALVGHEPLDQLGDDRELARAQEFDALCLAVGTTAIATLPNLLSDRAIRQVRRLDTLRTGSALLFSGSFMTLETTLAHPSPLMTLLALAGGGLLLAGAKLKLGKDLGNLSFYHRSVLPASAAVLAKSVTTDLHASHHPPVGDGVLGGEPHDGLLGDGDEEDWHRPTDPPIFI